VSRQGNLPGGDRLAQARPIPHIYDAVAALAYPSHLHFQLSIQASTVSPTQPVCSRSTLTTNPLREHNVIVRHFKPILKRAGLPLSIRLYDLRHSCATVLLEAGTHPKVVADRLGHSSVMLTLDTYSHVTPTLQQNASLKIANMIFGGQLHSSHTK